MSAPNSSSPNIVLPNILLIVTDNQSADSLGCYGNTEHETPRIDRLAREGTLFLRAFAASGLCSSARASLVTGLVPSQHGVHIALPDDDVMPKADDYDVTREFRTLPAVLAGRGYETAMVGKWHLGNHRCRGRGYEHWVALTKGHTTDFYDNQVYADGVSRRVTGQHVVEYFTDAAAAFLHRRDRARPFFLHLNYDGPYVLPPTVVGADPRNPYHERFAHRSFAPFPPVDDRIVRSLVTPFDFDLDPAEEYTLASAFNNVWWTLRIHNDQATRANVAAQNALVDACVGRVLDTLDDIGARDDTLVVFTTDQGNPYGQRGLWGHPQWTEPPFVHDVTFRVPLIVRQPGAVLANHVADEIVSHYDVLPTVLERLGEAPLTGAPGRSFTGQLTGAAGTNADAAAFFEAETVRAIRTTRYLCVNRMDGSAELYDLVADPDQWDDVAGDDRYASELRALSARIEEFWATYRDDRYDLWRGGTGQGMVSRYLQFKARYGPQWDVTMELGPPYEP